MPKSSTPLAQSDIVERLQAGEWGADVAAADEIKRLRAFEVKCETIRAATIEECEVTISDVFASTSPRDYMMNGSGGILKRMIDALRALKERQT